jgi:antitoxin component YwqK of YwqJK toxin-antitoxin module
MKKTLLFVLALIAVGCAEPIPRNLDGLLQQGDTYLDRETMRPYSGPVFDLAPDDTTRVQLSVNLKDGKMDGPYESYLYENGQLAYKGAYVAGEYHGPYESYWKNGELAGRGTYVAGEYHGPSETYHRNGQLDRKGTYVADEWHGLVENYYENGQLQFKTTYAAGEKDGPYESYDENGQLRHKGTFNMGEECGESFIFGRTRTYPPCPPGLEDGN